MMIKGKDLLTNNSIKKNYTIMIYYSNSSDKDNIINPDKCSFIHFL